ncbi:MAG: VOC family protein [Bacillota bacterium]
MHYFLRYEGGHIGVTGDRRAAVEWYCRHLGLTVGFDSAGDGQTLLRFPVRFGLPLVSMNGHLAGLWEGEAWVRESNVRMCLAAPDVERTHAQLADEGVRVTPIRSGPGGERWFDFYDLEGTRLTAVGRPALLAEAPAARFLGYAPLRIGVRSWEAARDWYQRCMGMTVVAEHPAGKAVLMELGSFEPIWLEEFPERAFQGPVSPLIHPNFLAVEIEAAHRWATLQGLSPSPLRGAPGDHSFFHLFDPDGNRINLYTYPGAQA